VKDCEKRFLAFVGPIRWGHAASCITRTVFMRRLLVITLPSSASLQLRSAPSPQFSLSRQPFAPTRVVERIVDLCCDPEAMKHHRELPRHGHRRSLRGVLATPGGYLLSVASQVRAEGTEDVVGAAYQELTLSISSPSLEMRF
jgi:hypothetical protein